uniref:Uncharacterized protein n=1 Tax=Timema poppense TaxID=170557 RepID=A0A7R9HEH1_TIMPO|nr:unnamed protein product [Timema poppensis]
MCVATLEEHGHVSWRSLTYKGMPNPVMASLYSLRANRPVPRLTLSFHIRSNTDAKLEALLGLESAPKPPPPLKDHTCNIPVVRVFLIRYNRHATVLDQRSEIPVANNGAEHLSWASPSQIGDISQGHLIEPAIL